MKRWAAAPEMRDQMVLFPRRLDEVIPPDHRVRHLDAILSQLDWSDWEDSYHERVGQPAIPPQVLAAILLYGMTCRIRSTRKLEEALTIRNDFRWLVEGRTVDHSTLAKFRKGHGKKLRGLFVKICILAQNLGFLSLARIGFDGTRERANNRRTGTRTPAQLREIRDALAAKYDEMVKQGEEEDARDEELFPDASGPESPASQDVGTIKTELDRLNDLLQNLEQGNPSECPQRIPITDTDSRVMPNKEGGFAPNYTPITSVDIASGLAVDGDVLNVINEDGHLIPSLENVVETFQLPSPPEVLTDGLNSTGANLAACHERGVIVYSPCEIPDPENNPALRENLQQPVSEDQWSRLPKHKVRINGTPSEQLDKSAFVYDAQENCYWCPMGRRLDYAHTTTEACRAGQRIRARYVAQPSDCDACPLRQLCVAGKAKSRQINREQHAAHQERHAQHMARSESQEIYKLRRHATERPFAVIKQQYGFRQFLCRGLETVKNEWLWALATFNLERLISLIRSRAGPIPSSTAPQL